MNKKFDGINKNYNQVEYAKCVFENGFSNGTKNRDCYGDLRLLVLYLRDYKKMKPKQREDFIYDFCKRLKPDFSVWAEYQIIDSILNYAKNKKHILKDIPCVEIYSSEIQYLKDLDIDYKLKKILFTLMVQGKLSKLCYKGDNEYDTYYVNESYYSQSKLAKNSCVGYSYRVQIMTALNVLIKEGLIACDYNSNFYLNFMKNIDNTNSKMLMQIYDYDNTGLYFDYLCGDDNIKFCKNCGKIFKIKGIPDNAKKYCKKCQGYVPLETKIIKCIDCGKEITVDSKDTKTIRCEECQKLFHYTPIETKIIKCIDCGKEISVDSKDSESTRCEDCYKIYRRKKVAEAVKKYRNKE